MDKHEDQDANQPEEITPEDLSSSDKFDTGVEKTGAENSEESQSAESRQSASKIRQPINAREKMKQVGAKFSQWFSLAYLKLNELLDLKGIEHKLPQQIKDILPENKRLVTMPVFIFIVGVLLTILLAIFSPEANKRTTVSDIPAVRVVNAKQENIRIPVYSQGLVLPEKEIKLVSLVNGPVTYVSPNFVEGGFVNKGELMLQISDRSYQQDKARAEANLARARAAQVAKQSELRVQGTLRTTAGRAQLIEVNAAVGAAEADVQRVDDLIDSTKFIAPFSGLLKNVVVQDGQTIRAGIPVAEIFSKENAIVNVPLTDRQLSLLDLTNLNKHIETEQNTEQAKNTELNNAAGDKKEAQEQSAKDEQISLPDVDVVGEFGDRTFHWKGKLIRSAGARNEVNRMHYVTVQIDSPFKEDPAQPGRPPLMPGFYVQLDIQGRLLENMIKLPRSAFKANQKVWTVSDKNTLESHDVELFYRGKNFIYVSKGINDGAKVVTSNLEVFADGMEVKPTLAETNKTDEKRAVHPMDNSQSMDSGTDSGSQRSEGAAQ